MLGAFPTNSEIYASWSRTWPYDVSGGDWFDEPVYDWVIVGYDENSDPIYGWQQVGTQPVWHPTYYGDSDNDGLGDNEDRPLRF
ncbi:MAG TPA: hypothetical protein VD994_02080 [Prosthecobacter sp.]|nr:hypothetical protein [Prosthecobacter sp.]